ncbi:MAG: VIT domain-containing protein [Syntrophobacteraceae bacterium]
MKHPFISCRQGIFVFFLVVLLSSFCSFSPSPALSAQGPATVEDKTLSPYFFIKSEDPHLDQLPLKSTSATVNVSGVIADVVVTQSYKNEGKKTLEAIYVFPASTRAAVYGMKMTIGERTITAQIQKREEARQAYEKARQEGKSASLLEQQRPNVFQMNVANILPGDEIKTELRYTEILIPTDGIYEFVYPTVVGPRYSNQAASSAPPSEKWSQNPYLHEGEAPGYTFDMKINLAAGVPIQEMSCSSHRTAIHYKDKTSASIDLDPSEKQGGNRDFILKYRLGGDRIESGMLLFKGEQENFFLLMMQPPKRTASAAIPPREYIFIVDVSGSMNGYPIDISKKLLKDLVSGLRPSDTFNVLLFAGSSQLLSERSLAATPQNVQRAIDVIDRQRAGGGTELLPALKRSFALPRTEGVSRTLIIATDGYVTVEPEIFDLIRDNIGEANFFAFGIGTSVNRHLIEGMARIGAGEPFIITKPGEAAAMAEKFRRYVQYPLLTRTKLDFGKFEAYDAEPSGVPDLFAERPVIVFGKWKGKEQGTITLSGTSGKEEYRKTLDISQIKPLPENSALRYLWARSRIAQLGDYNSLQRSEEKVGKITELGLKYNLLTAYTSFVAIDQRVRRKDGDVTTVKQPLPMPEGVSDLAVGEGSMNAPSAAPSTGFKYGGQFRARFDTAQGAAGTPARETKKAETTASRITIKELKVEGRPHEEIRKHVELHTADLLQCVQKERSQRIDKITIKWTIDKEGNAKEIQISMPGGATNELTRCLREQMEKWIFPVSTKSGTSRVVMTISVQ